MMNLPKIQQYVNTCKFCLGFYEYSLIKAGNIVNPLLYKRVYGIIKFANNRDKLNVIIPNLCLVGITILS